VECSDFIKIDNLLMLTIIALLIIKNTEIYDCRTNFIFKFEYNRFPLIIILIIIGVLTHSGSYSDLNNYSKMNRIVNLTFKNHPSLKSGFVDI
jgi:hypothetical protein